MKMKKVLSIVLSFIMLFSTLSSLNAWANELQSVETLNLVSADYEGIVLEGSTALGTITDFSNVSIKNVATDETVTLTGTVPKGSSASNGKYSEIYAELKANTVYELTVKNGFGGDAGTYSGADYVKYFKLNSNKYIGTDDGYQSIHAINIPIQNNSTVYVRHTPYYKDGSDGSFRVIIGETDTTWGHQTGAFIPWGAGAKTEIVINDASGAEQEKMSAPSDIPWGVPQSQLQKGSAVNRERIRVSGTWYRWARATTGDWDGKAYVGNRWEYDDTNNYIPKEGYVVFEAATTSFKLYDYDVVTMEFVDVNSEDAINLVSADYEGIVLEGSKALGTITDFSNISIKEVDTDETVTLGGTVPEGSSASNGNYSEIYAELQANTLYELTIQNGFGGDKGTYSGDEYVKYFKLNSEKYVGTNDGYQAIHAINIPKHDNSTVYIRYTPYYADGSNGSFRVIIGETDTAWGHQTGAFIPWGAGAKTEIVIKDASGADKEKLAVPSDLPWSVKQSSLEKGSVVNRERIRTSGTWYRWTRATYNEWDGKTYGSPRWQYDDTNNYIPKEGYVVFEAATTSFMLYDYDVVTAEIGDPDDLKFPDPDTGILNNVLDKYITKDGIETIVAEYDFESEDSLKGWSLSVTNTQDADGKVTDATHERVTPGANGTNGAYMHTAGGQDFCPRIASPDVISWNVGSTYQISAWLKAEPNAYFNPWINSSATVYSDINPSGSGYWIYGGKNLNSTWTQYDWKFTINDIKQDGSSVSNLGVAFMARLGADYPVGKLWMDEIVIKEVISGYTKLGLMAEMGQMMPGETMDLTIVGNNGIASYKVENDGMSFSSSDEEVATVDENGVVTALAEGSVRIAVTDGDYIGTIDLLVSNTNNAKTELHVAKNGSDETGDGSLDAPFATIERAKQAIRKYMRLPDGGVTVYVHEGEYLIDKTINFTAEDSGMEGAPIVYKAYEDDVVDFIGSVPLDATKATKVTDEALLNRLVEENAKNHLYQLPLGEHKMSAIAPYGWGTYITPNRIFMNDVALIEARWPNDDKTGEQYYTRAEPAKAGTYDASKYNGTGQPAILQYVDKENRSAKWQIKRGDALVGGAISYLWCAQDLRIGTLDAENKVVSTIDNSVASQDTYTAPTERYLYFKNIFEEIDMPGESYVDREKNILYFYPVGSLNDAKMEISVLNQNMIVFENASHITLDGINLKKMRQDAVIINNGCDSITVKNAEISGVSKHGVQLDGKNIVLEGCHIHDIGGIAVYLRGGDRPTLTSSGSKIINNSIHNVNHYHPHHMTAIMVYGVGHYIAHNEIYDTNTQSIRCEDTNNLVIEYNKFYDSELLNADGGVIYWGRNVTELGNIARYNYFREIGGNIGQHGQQSIFTDDGSVAPAIYGNIMYKGGKPNWPLKSNGGQFNNVHDNIIIDNEYGVYMQWWGSGPTGVKTEYIPASWWTYVTDTRDIFGDGNSDTFNATRKSLLFSDTWKTYYTETEPTKQWVPVFDYLSQEKYEAGKAVYDAGNKANYTKWLTENIPEKHTNMVERNVFINVPQIITGWVEERNNLSLSSAEGAALFEDFGTDFSLTEAGLAKIRQTIPDFEDLDFDAMGLISEVEGNKPSASDVTITGVPVYGGTLEANYSFADKDGDREGLSKVYWYASKTKDGNYTRITSGYGKNYNVEAEYEDQYIRCEVIPYDSKATYGEKVVSEPIFVKKGTGVNLVEILKTIDEAKSLLNSSEIGEEAGQYPKDAADALSQAITSATEIASDSDAYQFQVNQETELLLMAIEAFKNSKISDLNSIDIARIPINELIKEENQANWVDISGRGSVDFVDGSMVLNGGADDNKTIAAYKGKLPQNSEISFNIKAEPRDATQDSSEGWLGFYFRQTNENGWGWDSGQCAMFDLKQNKIQYQQYPTIAIVPELVREDKKFEMGKTHSITVGVYDVPDTQKVMIYLSIDGDVIYSDILESTALYNSPGFFAISVSENASNMIATITPVYSNTDKLEETIGNVEEFIASITVGSDYGQYPEDAIAELNDVLNDGKLLVGKTEEAQSTIDQAEFALRQALNKARGSVKDSGTISENGDVALNYNYPTANIVVDKAVTDATLLIDPSQKTPAINLDTVDVSMGIQKDSVLSGNINIPKLSASPSGTFNLGTAVNTYAQGDSDVTSDKPVRIVLKGQKGKNVAIKSGSNYTTITRTLTEDSFAAAEKAFASGAKAVRLTSGDDLVVYTTVLAELVTFDRASADEGDDEPMGGAQSGTPAKKPIGDTGAGADGGFFSSVTTTPNADATNTFVFSDMASHWAKSDVMSMYNAGIVSGVTSNTFEPDRPITRAEFATLITKGLKLTAEKTSDFKDVKADDWFAPYVGAAAKAGIIVGSDGKFRPNDTITREEMAVIIVKAYTYLGGKGANGAIDNFSDKAKISTWAKPYVDSAASVGLISGMGDGTFGPKASATRAQAASVVYRVIK